MNASSNYPRTIENGLDDFAFAGGMAALAGYLGGVFASFAMGTAILFGGHTGARWVGTSFRVCHLGAPLPSLGTHEE
jgi:hypothetical protein